MKDKNRLIAPLGSIRSRGNLRLDYTELEDFFKNLEWLKNTIRMIKQDDYDAKLISITYYEESRYTKEKYRIIYAIKPQRKLIMDISTKYKAFLKYDWVLISLDKDYVLKKINEVIKEVDDA